MNSFIIFIVCMSGPPRTLSVHRTASHQQAVHVFFATTNSKQFPESGFVYCLTPFTVVAALELLWTATCGATCWNIVIGSAWLAVNTHLSMSTAPSTHHRGCTANGTPWAGQRGARLSRLVMLSHYCPHFCCSESPPHSVLEHVVIFFVGKLSPFVTNLL